MSRVGKLPIPIPAGVEVKVSGDAIVVKGPKGELTQAYEPEVEISVQDGTGMVTRRNDSKRARSMHGLYRNLLNNMVTGVSSGFQRTLVITGVGYRAEMSGQNLLLNLGYSNPIEYRAPEGVTLAVDGQTKVIVSGIDKQAVGQAASEIRSLRPPEPYKGKGVRYEDEQIRRKVGKSGIK